MEFKPGWHKDISDEDYHSSNGVSSSTLKKWLTMAPNEVLHSQMNPKKETDSLTLGKLVHAFVLEPEKAEDCFVVLPEINKRTKQGRADFESFVTENEGKIICKREDLEKAKRMAQSVFDHPDARLLLDGTINESSVYWWYKKRDDADDRDYKQICKVRPDAISTNYPMLIDLKTSDDASYESFQHSVNKYYYHLSAAMYLNGVNQCHDIRKECNPEFYKYFAFIVVSKTPAFDTVTKSVVYNTAVYSLDQKSIDMGNQLYRHAMMRLHDAKHNNYPGLPSGIRDLELPPWGNKIPIV